MDSPNSLLPRESFQREFPRISFPTLPPEPNTKTKLYPREWFERPISEMFDIGILRGSKHILSVTDGVKVPARQMRQKMK